MSNPKLYEEHFECPNCGATATIPIYGEDMTPDDNPIDVPTKAPDPIETLCPKCETDMGLKEVVREFHPPPQTDLTICRRCNAPIDSHEQNMILEHEHEIKQATLGLCAKCLNLDGEDWGDFTSQVDRYVKEYLIRAYQLYNRLSDTNYSLVGGLKVERVVEIAKMIQLEDHRYWDQKSNEEED